MSNGPILVVDDEPQNLAVLRQILAPQYKLIFATNGADALNAVAKFNPSLILLDVNLPDISGYQVCEALQKDPATDQVPVIFVTTMSEVGQESRGFAVGAVDYIVKPVNPDIVRARVKTQLSLVRAGRLEKSYHDAIAMLGEAGHYSDADTAEHVWRMAAYAGAIAQGMGLSDEECKLIEDAAPLHDTGKIGVPSSILRKPGPLDAAEWAVMKTHPYIGWKILSQSDAAVFQISAMIALGHHEKWDGSGYPRHLAGESIPLAARIVAVADVFDALSTKRPYKEAWPYEQSLDWVRDNSDKHFDPTIVQVFLDIQPRIVEIKSKWDHVAPKEVRGVVVGAI
jgi:putative two-component system response regulator